ncbi:glycosyltransferase family 2 protein [Bradyrhizobium japonicum]|uniref:glycosyltransferase family 2 protein n=1 Tax=Bradyrhizobium japonicum TaxID=375 RepID=UPI001BABFBFA|nr:glycosyltransferase family 2 protein [Bradyrhizobium japonicum]MBR0749938.1 glycosyltransferase family 2 protein [Bradyrhizobium japonicum]
MRKVLIVVPVLNEAKTISPVLESLLDGTEGREDLTLVVADGGSTDGTQNIVARLSAGNPTIRLMNNPGRIQSAGVNLAVQTHGAGADVLIRCDAHAGYPPNFIGALLDTMDRTGADSVVVPMDTIGNGCVQNAIAWASNSVVGTGGSAHRGGRKSGFVDHGHHAAMRIASFAGAGGYNSAFTHNEDAELDFRLRAFGAKIYLDSETRIEYYPRSSLGKLWTQYFNYGFGRLRTITRHPSSLRLRQFAVPLNLALVLLSIALAPLTPIFLLWPALYLSILAAASVHAAITKRSVCGLLVGVAALVMHSSWAMGLFTAAITSPERRWQKADQLPLAGVNS